MRPTQANALLSLLFVCLAACGGGGTEIDPALDDGPAEALGAAEFLEARSESVALADVAIHPLGHGLSTVVVNSASGREVEARLRAPDGSLEPAEVIDTGSVGLVALPAVSAGGNRAVVLVDEAGNLGDAALRYYDDAVAAWRPRLPLETGAALDTDDVAAAMDAPGNLIVATEEIVQSTQAHRVSARRYTATGTLETAQLFDQRTGDVLQLQVAMNDAGVAVVAWAQSVAGTTSVFAATYEPGPGWSGPTEIDGVANTAFLRGVAVASDGHAVVLIASHEGAGDISQRLRVVTYLPPAAPVPGWQPSVPLFSDFGDMSDQAMHMAADGQCVIVYAMATALDGSGVVRAVRFSVADGIGPTVRLSAENAPAIEDTDLGVAINARGDLVTAWTEAPGDEVLVGAIVPRDGVPSTGLLLREQPIATGIANPAIGVSPSGDGMVVWKEMDPDTQGPEPRRHGARRIGANGVMSGVAFLTAQPGDRAGNPHIAMDDSGLGTLIWLHADTSTGHMDARVRTFR